MKRQGSWPLEDALLLPEAQRRRLDVSDRERDHDDNDGDGGVANQPGAYLDLGALPPEMIEMVLTAAGPFGAARCSRLVCAA